MAIPSALPLANLQHSILSAGNVYTVCGGGTRTEAFREALQDLQTRSFPSLEASGMIRCLDIDLAFSLSDSVQTMLARFKHELEELHRCYGDDI